MEDTFSCSGRDEGAGQGGWGETTQKWPDWGQTGVGPGRRSCERGSPRSGRRTVEHRLRQKGKRVWESEEDSALCTLSVRCQ